MGKPQQPWQPPKGVRYKQQPGRPNPFLLIWSDGGAEKSKAYANESARELAARALAENREKAGDPVLQFNAKLWRRYLEFQAIVVGDVDPLIVAHEWRASKQGRPARPGMPVAEGVKRYFALRDRARSWGTARNATPESTSRGLPRSTAGGG